MFRALTESVSVAQHHRVDLIYVGAGQVIDISEPPPGTDFIAAAGADLASAKLNASGAFCASLVSPYQLTARAATVIIRTYNTRAMDQVSYVDIGEPGALSYIDGCSNTDTISPIRNGDPCLNYLYFPPGAAQSLHTHPSVRIGLVLSGEGVALAPNDPTKRTPLTPGTVFLLDRHTLHAFNTEGSHMSLFAFHPDSEAGPTDEGNPMKTRTYLR